MGGLPKAIRGDENRKSPVGKAGGGFETRHYDTAYCQHGNDDLIRIKN